MEKLGGWVSSILGIIFIAVCIKQVISIGCFVCTSINGSNKQCEDTFNNTNRKVYNENCWAGRRGRSGLFPATQCIKMKAEIPSENYSIIVRNCVADNGDITSESEIGRITHCGWIRLVRFNGKDMNGCILTCSLSGCNSANSLLPPLKVVFSSAFVAILLILSKHFSISW